MQDSTRGRITVSADGDKKLQRQILEFLLERYPYSGEENFPPDIASEPRLWENLWDLKDRGFVTGEHAISGTSPLFLWGVTITAKGKDFLDLKKEGLINPDLGWYTNLSKQKGMLPRCPYASVHRCPRYYQGLSLMGIVGSTKIEPREDERLKQQWNQSELWPTTAEQASALIGNPARPYFYKFCPEVLGDRFGLFATGLGDYSDGTDRERASKSLEQQGISPDDWRWKWASVETMHYSECPLYSLLAHDSTRRDSIAASNPPSTEAIMILRPSFFGVGVNLKAAWTLIKKWWQARRDK